MAVADYNGGGAKITVGIIGIAYIKIENVNKIKNMYTAGTYTRFIWLLRKVHLPCVE